MQPLTNQQKQRLSQIAKERGFGKWMKGRRLSAETRRKQSEAAKGRVRSHLHCLHISQAKKGVPNLALRGRTRNITPEWREKLNASKRGRPMTEGQRRCLSLSWGKGAKSHFWKGGITSKNAAIRSSTTMRRWRKAVFERDNYTCVWCKQKGGNLNADHIKPFAFYPELRFDLCNGRTLCVNCHKLTDTYLSKAYAHA